MAYEIALKDKEIEELDAKENELKIKIDQRAQKFNQLNDEFEEVKRLYDME